MKDAQLTARILTQALPYIQAFRAKTIVIKYGGQIMSEKKLKHSFATDLVLLKSIGINPIVVHGGGPQISHLLQKIGKRTTFVEGIRVTDEETLSIVEMVLGGSVNKQIVDLIQQAGGKAVGLTGKDAKLLCAKKYTPKAQRTQPNPIDLGYVGEIETVNRNILDILVEDDYIPVIAPIATSEIGITYNVNADMAAAAIASALSAEKLLLLTDTPGVLDEKNQTLSNLTHQEAETLIQKGTIHSGMLPKIQCALQAVDSGVQSAHIIDGRVAHAILFELLTKEGVGTIINR